MLKTTIAATVLLLAGALAYAKDPAASQDKPDRQQLIETHQKIADVHLQAVECLKAGKDMKECHDALVKDCPMAKGGGCPFGGKGCPYCAKGHGHHHGMMKAQPKETAPETPTKETK